MVEVLAKSHRLQQTGVLIRWHANNVLHADVQRTRGEWSRRLSAKEFADEVLLLEKRLVTGDLRIVA